MTVWYKIWCSLTKKLTNFVLWWEILLNWILICFSENKDLFPRCYAAKKFFGIAYFTDILSFSKRCKGNDTANCVKSIKLGVVVSIKTLIQNFEGATILGHVTDDVSNLYKWIFLPPKQVVLYTVGE